MNELLRTLYVTTPGTSLHLEGDTVRVVHPDKPGRHLLPLVRLSDIVAFNGVTVTDDLLHRCAADTRPVTWVTRNGRFLARAHGPHNGNGLLRLAQARAHDDPDHRAALSRAFVAGKLHNYRQLLLRTARDATGPRQTTLRDVAERHATALLELPNANSPETILGIEGRAARDYFQALPHLAAGAPPGRTRRPPLDPVNCLLSFGYAMLRIAVHGACEQVGLDPHIGYLHGIRPAKPALALDLMEELRPLLVDRLVFTLLNRGQLNHRHTQAEPGGAVTLTDDGRKAFLQHWSTARERTWHHAALNRDVPAGLLPLLQARLLARHLRGDTPTYHPWTLT
ncbi:type I-C CRISPR-associated endonuclease Cas1c [Actinokineospora sp. UTMC 2448]|uniref:type I-C CRISPR-associated endonuclease Cas1c n=1 Tax=Actinokineospora sp. UTMC 2448 TaxID=2268449 RepID=UPI00216414B6|nr:type I-C CRISPR-associated endonuclease Cas1c [Actinokineospora sp. UTMC 2448]UVS80614.1 CRISPR-associated endonuclease Cas1 [Actinokineospora sp. UTMC 2448]